MQLIKDYFDKTIQYKEEYGENTIVIMQCGSFFEVYALIDNDTYIGSNIIDFSNICDLNIVEKKATCDGKQVVMAGFKEPYWEKYTKKMQERGYSVVIITQDEACANTTRSLFGIFSPGSYFNENTDMVSNFTCCIWLEKLNLSKLNQHSLIIGVSLVDILTGQSYLYEFNENMILSPNTFDQVEKIVSSFSPSETIVISAFSNEEINAVINFIQLNSKTIHKVNINDKKEIIKNCGKQTYQKEILTKYFSIADFNTFYQDYLNNPVAAQSYCYLLDFLYQHNTYLTNKLTQPEFYKNQEKLLLANHTLKQLNIINIDEKNSKMSSMVNMLNDCCTNMGKRHFKYQLLNPTTNIEFLNQEYKMIESLKSIDYEKYRNNLQHIPDLSVIKRKLIMKKITPKNIYKLNESFVKIQNIIEIVNNKTWENYFCNKLNISLSDIEQIVFRIKSSIEKSFDLDKCKFIDTYVKFESNFINCGINEKLDNSINQLNKKEECLFSIKEYLNNLLLKVDKTKKKDVELIKYHETEKNNISLILTDKRSKLLEGELKKGAECVKIGNFSLNLSQITFSRQSASNKFISSSDIIKLTKEIYRLKLEVMDNILISFKKIVEELDCHSEEIEKIIQFIVLVDVIVCKTYLAEKYRLSFPIIDTKSANSFANFTGLRHLLIEQLPQEELYVPNNIDLGCNDSNGILLYGTNRVGKTSFIKSIGIAVIMAQAGMFVPCQMLVYKPYTTLFTRLLGCDNIFKGLSTFEVEMTELRSILKYSNSNSLVLGDELCSGTESSSAKSIFVAGVKKLYYQNCSFIFATHLHEIVSYDEIQNLPNLKLKHMEVLFNREKNRLEYNRIMQDGPGEAIYGLEVCKALDMPDDFLKEANEIRMKYNPMSKSILGTSKSKYNSKKLKGGKCEICKINPSTEIHHLIAQKEFNDKIKEIKNLTLTKNKLANLCSICESCHDKIHQTNSTLKRIKTSNGFDLVEI